MKKPWPPCLVPAYRLGPALAWLAAACAPAGRTFSAGSADADTPGETPPRRDGAALGPALDADRAGADAHAASVDAADAAAAPAADDAAARPPEDAPKTSMSADAAIDATALPPATWKHAKLGPAAVTAGKAEIDPAKNTIVLTGSGEDIWHDIDEGQFAYQEQGEAWQITTRVSSFDAADGWAKAGIMFREDLKDDARMVATRQSAAVILFVSKANGCLFAYRFPEPHDDLYDQASDAPNDPLCKGARVPFWLRLTRAGISFTGEISKDGTTWTKLGTRLADKADPKTGARLGPAGLVGVAVSSAARAAAATARFDPVTVERR